VSVGWGLMQMPFGRSMVLLLVGLPAAGSMRLPAMTASPWTPSTTPVVSEAAVAVAQQTSPPPLLGNGQYLAKAAAVSCILRGGSDLVGQVISGSSVPNIAHIAAMGTVGLLFSGFVGATWLAALERHVSHSDGGDESCMRTVCKKTTADFCLYAPLANSAYLLAVPFLTAAYSQLGGLDVASSLCHSYDTWHEGFGSAMQLEASMFVPFNLLSFRVIPATLRPHAAALMR